jgi:KipI family sensor histidine kinase inhibitor
MAGRAGRTAQISELAEPGVRLLRLGDQAITLELPEENAERVLGLAAALDERIAAGAFPGAGEAVPAIRSVTLHFDPLAADPDSWLDELKAIAETAPTQRPRPREWTLPVCFDAEFAPDLAEIAASPKDFIEALTAEAVTVKMLGFLPGFAYMGDIPELCRAPRRQTPRSAVPAGSVAVAGALCAAYPWTSPGGWNLIGRTPVPLFDPANQQRPALLAPGDRVRWKPVSRAEFEQS